MSTDINYTDEIYNFTRDFFHFFGAKVKKKGRKNVSPLDVTLPSDFADSFGYSTLHLVFSPDDLSKMVGTQKQAAKPELEENPTAAENEKKPPKHDAKRPVVKKHSVELVASGSRIFDRMISYLDTRSALTLQKLPSNFTGGEELMAAVRPTNTSIAKLNMQEQLHNLYIYNWHVTYRADDKYEEILTVAIDASGNLYPLAGTVGETAQGAASDESELPHLDTLLADGEPIEPEIDEDGEHKSVPLPPMTELTRLAETARKYAIYHADVRCVAHEVEVQQRLYRVLNRLNSYYTQQIEEVYDSHDASGEKRGALERDLRRKIGEEVENHRLRVQVRLFSYAILQVPIAIADLTLSDGKQEVAVRVRRNQYSGTIQRPACHACDQETSDIAIDRNGHVTCGDCIQQCGGCTDILCADCGVEPCSVCAKDNCDTCGKECWACGERACTEHISGCPTCRDTVCHTCQTECAECGVRQCRSHLRADCVIKETDADTEPAAEPAAEPALVCASCAVRCLGCAQYSAQIDTCEKSGQRFCLNCLESCTECENRVGPDYFVVNPSDKEIYCRDCVTVCPACDSQIAELSACQECGADCCAKCSATCETCQAVVCTDHTVRGGVCGHTFCNAHGKRCAIGGESVCPSCDAVCGICQRAHCTHHTESCGLCRCTYCTDCMNDGLGLCDTCATIREDGQVVRLDKDPIAAHPDVQPFIHGYRWTMASNLHYTIYLGEGPFNTGALILVQNSADGPQPQTNTADKQSGGPTKRGKEYIVDEFLENHFSAGEKLRSALLESGLVDGEMPLQKFEKKQLKKPKDESDEQADRQTNERPQVLVARKINALDLLWRER